MTAKETLKILDSVIDKRLGHAIEDYSGEELLTEYARGMIDALDWVQVTIESLIECSDDDELRNL